MIKLIYLDRVDENNKILRCKKLSNDMIFLKYSISEGDIIQIEENQCVCVIEKGNVLDIKDDMGYYLIRNKENSLEQLKNITIKKCEDESLCVIFINKNIIKNNKYIFREPIKYKKWKDNEYIQLFIKLEGNYSLKIEEPKLFLRRVIGLRTHYSKQELIEQIRKFILKTIEEGRNEISEEYKLDIDRLVENSKKLELKLKENEYDKKLLEYGVKIVYFDISKLEIVKKKSKFF